LAKSVEEQVQLENGDVFVGIVNVKVPHHKFSFNLKMKEGENFMVCATEGSGRELLSEYLECTCAGESFFFCASISFKSPFLNFNIKISSSSNQ
jgi:hypothetical protein